MRTFWPGWAEMQVLQPHRITHSLASRQFNIRRTLSTTEKDDTGLPTATIPANTLTYPDAPTTAHHDLASFLTYAERTNLNQASTTFIGTHFEYTVAAALSDYGFRLRRVGGQSDLGIDLLGTWSVPSSPSHPLRVVLQCKAVTSPRPHLLRELEGAFVGASPGWRGRDVLGFLVTNGAATDGMRSAMGRSRWPMGCISCSRTGHVQQIIWNRHVEAQGLQGTGIGLQYSPDVEGGQRLVLTFKGNHLPFPYNAGDQHV